MRTINNWYIKDYGDGRHFISGMAIPRDADGITRDIDFVRCDFHCASQGNFLNCRIDGVLIPDGPGCLYEYDQGSLISIAARNKVRAERGQPELVWDDKLKWTPRVAGSPS